MGAAARRTRELHRLPRGTAPELHFYQPADYWHRPPQLPEEPWLQEFDVKVLREPDDARATLAAGGERTAFIGEWQPGFAAWGFAAANPTELLAILHFQRAIKSAYEVECLRVASQLGVRGHVAARDAFRAGASEYEVHLAYCAATGLTEVELPYDNIIAFDTGGAILHNHHRSRERDVPRRSMLIDAGAEFRGYASDITRTYAGGDHAFEQLIASLDAAQQRICAAVKPGADYRDVHLLAHRLVAGLLHDVGVIRCDADTAVANGVSAVFLPHGIGHLLGLQVHDVAGFAQDTQGGEIARPPGHPYLRLTRVLEPGFVVTIEPGLYFIDMLLAAARADQRGQHIDWNEVERWRPFGGIRIEDDVVCTTSAPLNLTREAFAAVTAS
jgi:Xaa-Pro dipeptidase